MADDAAYPRGISLAAKFGLGVSALAMAAVFFAAGGWVGEKRNETNAARDRERLEQELAAAKATARPDPSMLVPAWARQVHWHWQLSLGSKDDAETRFVVTTAMYRPDKRGSTEVGIDASDNEAAFDRTARVVLNRWLSHHAGCRFEEPMLGRAVVAAQSHDGPELATTFSTIVICPNTEMTDVLRDPFSGIRADLDRTLRNPQEILREAAKLEKEAEAK